MSLLAVGHPRRNRTKPSRPITAQQASRALRRAAPPTTGRTWKRSALPEPALVSVGVPTAEAVVSLLLVAFCWAPVVVISAAAGWAVVSAVVSLGVAAVALRVRRVIIGKQYVAIRQIGRFHVASVDHVRHLELRPTGRGGVLCVHTDDGRCMRLRRVEVARPEVNAALRRIADLGAHTRDERVEELLSLEHTESRLRHRYLADAVQ